MADATDPELVLLARWREGDRDAGQALLTTHFAALHRFFRGKLPGDVQDLVQRTLLDVVERRDALPEHVSLRAYLFAVARHRLIDHLRAQAVRGVVVDPACTSIAALVTSPSAAVGRDEEQLQLAAAMRELPIDLQITLELAYWEGLRGPEIAEVLGIGAATVRSRLTRARTALRERLAVLDRSAAAAMFERISRAAHENDAENDDGKDA